MDEFSIGFPPIQQALQKLLDFSESDLQILSNQVATPEAFERSIERCESLAKQLEVGISPRDVFNILASLEFLYNHSRAWERSAPAGHDSLNEFLEFTGLNQKLGPRFDRSFRNWLKTLLQVNPSLQRREKLRRLKSTLLDTAVGFSSFVDLRPSFAENRSGIEALIPVVILSVAIRTEAGPDTSYVFQMSTEGMAKLRATVADIDKKIAALGADDSLKSRLDMGSNELDDE
jgi:hypothetical protein